MHERRGRRSREGVSAYGAEWRARRQPSALPQAAKRASAGSYQKRKGDTIVIRGDKLDHLLEQFIRMERGPVGCALSVSLRGQTVYEGYRGMADLETGRKIDPFTVYRIYSCTKVITAAALMILLERGTVKLDDPVERYLPEYANPVYSHYTGNNLETLKPAGSLTLKHLITMTSGFTYPGDRNSTQKAVGEAMADLEARVGFSTREFAARMAEVPLAFKPGTRWNYGIGHDVLGAAIEAAAGKPFGEFLKDEIFTPLQMNDTGFVVSEKNAEHLATLYRYEHGRAVPNLSEEYKFRETYRFESAGGGLLSTLGDMTRFAQALTSPGRSGDKRILGRKSIELMSRNHLDPVPLSDFRDTHAHGWSFMSGYGYGLGVKTLIDLSESNGLGSVGEFSWAGAAGTWVLMDPAEELSIVYMHQLLPMNREGDCHPVIKNVVYGML